MNLGKGYKEKPFQYIATGFKLFHSPNCPNFLLYFKLHAKMTCYIIIQHFQNQIKWMSPWILDGMLNVFFEILVLDLSDPNFCILGKTWTTFGGSYGIQWCSCYHNCTSAFSKNWPQFLHRFKPYWLRVGGLQWWEPLTNAFHW